MPRPLQSFDQVFDYEDLKSPIDKERSIWGPHCPPVVLGAPDPIKFSYPGPGVQTRLALTTALADEPEDGVDKLGSRIVAWANRCACDTCGLIAADVDLGTITWGYDDGANSMSASYAWERLLPRICGAKGGFADPTYGLQSMMGDTSVTPIYHAVIYWNPLTTSNPHLLVAFTAPAAEFAPPPFDINAYGPVKIADDYVTELVPEPSPDPNLIGIGPGLFNSDFYNGENFQFTWDGGAGYELTVTEFTVKEYMGRYSAGAVSLLETISAFNEALHLPAAP